MRCTTRTLAIPLLDGRAKPETQPPTSLLDGRARHVGIPAEIGRDAVGLLQSEDLSDLGRINQIVGVDLDAHQQHLPGVGGGNQPIVALRSLNYSTKMIEQFRGHPTSRAEEDAVGALFARLRSDASADEPPHATAAVLSPEVLKERICESLLQQGFTECQGVLTPPPFVDKEDIRKRNAVAVELARSKAAGSLRRHQEELLKRFALGSEVNVGAFSPRLVEVKPDSEEELLFRFTRLQWSIPTSAGYGRRLRFLVIDESNDKLVGVIGLGDPVFALGARDRWIGWTRDQSRMNLHNVMDAFVLGAVPPYSFLLAGKLVALLVASDEVRTAYSRKYGRSSSRIIDRDLRSRLLLVTTTSALGRSSIYNRLRYGKRTVFESIGYTSGSGDFHFTNGLYADIRRFAEANCTPTAKQEKWGSGFRNRREVIRKVLLAVGLSGDWQYHGLEREIFAVPMAHNARDLLQGRGTNAQWYHSSVGELSSWYRSRWMEPRAAKQPSFHDFDPACLRLWPKSTRG